MPDRFQYPAVFADPKIESEFSREGYVLLPLLDEPEVDRLRLAYAEDVPELPDPFFMTGVVTDVARRKRLAARLYEVLGPPLARLMPEYTVITGRNFVVKRGADNASGMPMHQDFTFVDQTAERGVHVWIPLVDVNHENGCLKVAPGSHRLINHVAGPGGYISPYDSVRDFLEKECTLSLPMKAGEAFFFDERLMHGSEPNTVPDDRPAANIAFIRNGHKQRIHVYNAETPGVLDIYEIDHEFAIRYSTGVTHTWIDPEAVRKIGTLQYSPVPLKVEQLEPLRVRRPVALAEAPTVAAPAKPVPMPAMTPRAESTGFFSRLFGRV